MKYGWKRRIVDGQVWYERSVHNARLFVRGKRERGSYRWIIQHRRMVHFGWSSRLDLALDDAEEQAEKIDMLP